MIPTTPPTPPLLPHRSRLTQFGGNEDLVHVITQTINCWRGASGVKTGSNIFSFLDPSSHSPSDCKQPVGLVAEYVTRTTGMVVFDFYVYLVFERHYMYGEHDLIRNSVMRLHLHVLTGHKSMDIPSPRWFKM